MQEPLLNLKNIHKEFIGVKALSGVDFELHKGTIVSLVGTNGAGKSTLSNIIAGVFQPSQGDVYIEGEKVRLLSPKDAERFGIGYVHQEPTLVPHMTVVENLFLNRELVKNGVVLDFNKMKEESKKTLDFLGFKIDVNRTVDSLSIVEKEVVEIAKAMLLKPRILILDEVTAPLNKVEVEHLFKVIRELKSNGMGIIFIGHRIKEIIQISDRIVVLRDGKIVAELDDNDEIQEKHVIQPMLGEIIDDSLEDCMASEIANSADEELLRVEDLSKSGYYSDIRFSLNKGEILGFAGLKGSGVTEIFKSIQGICKYDDGKLYVKNAECKFNSPREAIDGGVGMITNDRQGEGLALTLDVKDNISISSLKYLGNKLRFINMKILRKKSKEFVEAMSIKTPSIDQKVMNLSGGNQQKIVIAKWLLRDLDVIIIDEPTRGVDVKAKTEIYKLLLKQKNQGKGILVSSPEIRELLTICDRILIVVLGKIVCEIKRSSKKFNEPEILEIIHASN
jgi:ribose transport system ATP-binding protein